MSEDVHVTCRALPMLLGEGLVDNSDPSMAAMLPNLVALGSLPEGPGLGLAALLGLEPHADPQALGTEALISWVASWAPLGCCVCQVGEGRPDPGSASSPLLGRPPRPRSPTVFRGFPHGAWGTLSSWAQAVGSRATRFLEWNSRRSWSGAWHWNPTCFVSGISW